MRLSQILYMLLVPTLLLGSISCTKKSDSSSESNPSNLKGKTVMVTFKTNLGEFKLELDHEKAPVTVENFIDYVESGHYDGTIFHRVIDGFMAQGGGFDKDMNQKPTNDPIKNESSNGLKNKAMTVAMARTNDPDSATSQFFINLVDNAYLDGGPGGGGYAVFGKVVSGEEVIKKMATVPTTTVGPYENVPAEPIVIEKASYELSK